MRINGNNSNCTHQSFNRHKQGRQMRKSDIKSQKLKHRIVKQENQQKRDGNVNFQVVDPIYPEIMLQIASLVLRQNV